MRRKGIIFLLCVSMVSSVLTGCGDKKTTTSKTEKTTQEPVQSTKTEETDKEETTQEVQTPEATVSENTAKPAQTPTSQKKDSASSKKTETSETEEPKDLMSFSAKVENNCEKMTIKSFSISSYGENAWSDNLLTSPVAYGKVSKKMKLRMPADQLRWDLKVVTEKGKKVIFRELDVSECDTSHITITLMYDEEGNPVAIAV